ncbi:MAG: hypothetical protein IKR89_00395 [Bacteroidaceae bacterium]|nr:hypothetical protein [Bacteroidaceae bacterium]
MREIKKHGLSFVETESNIEENEEFNIAKELIENLFFDMAKLSTKYCNDTFCDLPYTYSERRLDSVLLPALSKLCNSMVLVEVPAIRECANGRFNVEKSNGRIDYWCIYKNYSFVIELKHSFDCFTTNSTKEDRVVSRWIEMHKQLQSLKKDVKGYTEKTKGVIRIGLHMITSYSKNRDKQLLKEFKNNIPNTFERFQKDFGKKYPSLKPDFILCWKIPSKIVEMHESSFPGFWAITKIYPAIKHHGAIK